jgi:hypothetical protein
VVLLVGLFRSGFVTSRFLNRQGSAAKVVVPSIFSVVHYGHSDGVQGREILQSTVDLVQNTLNLEVLTIL